MATFKVIACINTKGVMGNDGSLLYHIKSDMANFQRATTGNVVVMGRRTFESLPDGLPLRGRVNIILTQIKDYSVTIPKDRDCDLYITHSLEETVELCEAMFQGKELFLIGGADTILEFWDQGLINELRLTIVNDDADGDTVFPMHILDSPKLKLAFETLPQKEIGKGNPKFRYKIYKK